MPHPLVSTLVLGGARSGKSRFAETLVTNSAYARIYVATARALDDEMRERIAHHRAARAADGWRTIEEPFGLADAIAHAAAPGTAILVDCLTLWLSELMMRDADLGRHQSELVRTLQGSASPIVLVSNEVGLGLVPETPLGRAFRDAQGRLNQAVAAAVPRVAFIAAGLPLWLKGAS